ncbi:NUDIX hydrolase [Paenibacillus mendelii]|uniref:NUDIX domain-containing protein n=1 Tax=Paenibacillus mendelii TaxID=206163 RepID=A0ABV6JBD1_9BACL|nr:NUDIX domain-containing protein [Paenibacillus mendelii]MCQ6562992.1 NUDIX hydrolase [Paenibacillus mendelii]
MNNEVLKVFDGHGKELGVATREEVHRLGHWHEAIHCWFVHREEDIQYIYLQIRSPFKKDYPNLLDITAAGHLLAHETVNDGVREIEEELGIEVAMSQLIPLGVLHYSVTREDFIDKELANVFLYVSEITFDDFKLQQEEVSGIVRADFESFLALWLGGGDEINVKGYETDHAGTKVPVNKMVGKDNFVPHGISYYKDIINLISSNT